MFIFGNKKRYTIGEKISYFNSIIKNKNYDLNKRNWAKLRKSQLNLKLNEIKLGDVFVVDDNLMGNPRHKPRVVVIAKLKNDKVNLLPVRKSNTILSLQNFDNDRQVDFKKSKLLSKYRLFEKRGFRITNNAYLTPKEKVLLQKKANKYLP